MTRSAAHSGERVRRREVRPVAAAAVLLLAACTMAPVRPEPAVIQVPRPARATIAIGVRFTDAFRAFAFDRRAYHRSEYDYPAPIVIGEPSVRLLTEALGLLFSDVHDLSDPDALRRAGTAVAGVIEPSVASVDYDIDSDAAPARAEITYRLTLTGVDGAAIATWSVTGRGHAVPLGVIFMVPIGPRLKESFERAMREAAWNFTTGFRDVPGVRPWLEAHGAR